MSGDDLARASLEGEDVGVTRPGHVVLLDGLVEGGLAQEHPAQAKPRGQQPGHGAGRLMNRRKMSCHSQCLPLQQFQSSPLNPSIFEKKSLQQKYPGRKSTLSFQYS